MRTLFGFFLKCFIFWSIVIPFFLVCGWFGLSKFWTVALGIGLYYGWRWYNTNYRHTHKTSNKW